MFPLQQDSHTRWYQFDAFNVPDCGWCEEDVQELYLVMGDLTWSRLQ